LFVCSITELFDRYAFFFFADPAVERMAKRFMRDRVRYLDEIHCAGGRVIDGVMKSVLSSGAPLVAADSTGRYLVELPMQISAPATLSLSESKSKSKSRPLAAGKDTDNEEKRIRVKKNRQYRLIPVNNSYVA
jgi:hypothetical protein